MASQSAAFPPTKWPRDAKVLASGAVAGACSRSSVAPLERVKIMMQVQDLVADGKAMHGTRYNSTLEVGWGTGEHARWHGRTANSLLACARAGASRHCEA